MTNKFLNTIFALLSLYFLLIIDKKSLFFSGFFIGILWFWWIGYSFIYYDLAYLIPFIILGIGLVYGILFYLTAIIDKVIIRIILICSLSFIEPFGFNWLKLDLLFLNTYFNQYQSKIQEPNLKIYMPKYEIPQDKKWDRNYLSQIIEMNFSNIDFAIKNNYELVILPETTFPLILNQDEEILDKLKEKSNSINIITGGISLINNQYLNTTYLFSKGDFTIANKVVLVPFGEAIPLPKILRDFINNTFFNGASDYESAKTPTTFDINGIKFRNAICFEATTDEIYQNLDTHFIIATSNNGWFVPSIEPVLQKLLLTYYAKKYNLVIYHATNMSENMIIK